MGLPRQLIFLRKSDCLGCAVLLCLVVCLTLLSSFLLISHLNMYMYVHIAGIVESLVDSASDKSDTTRHAVVKALVDIGRRKHTTVLRICHSYLKKHSKVSE